MRWISLLALVLSAASTASAAEGTTFHFAHRDEQWLDKGDGLGGIVYVPGHADMPAALPVLVFLHGTNPGQHKHLWMGGGNVPDLREVVDGWTGPKTPVPFLLAAPSQVSNAQQGSTLWPAFDLAAFLADLEAALPISVDVDHQRIVVVGHSGAGCNGKGGLASVADGAVPVRALVALDTCLDEPLATALLRSQEHVDSVSVFFQTTAWKRDFDGFTKSLGGVARVRRLDVVTANPHDDIVAPALRQIALDAFGPSPLP